MKETNEGAEGYGGGNVRRNLKPHRITDDVILFSSLLIKQRRNKPSSLKTEFKPSLHHSAGTYGWS